MKTWHHALVVPDTSASIPSRSFAYMRADFRVRASYKDEIKNDSRCRVFDERSARRLLNISVKSTYSRWSPPLEGC